MLETSGEISIIIHAPAHALYAYLLDFTRHSEWAANLSKVVQLSPGPIGVGTSFRTQEGPPPLPLPRKLAMMVYFVKGVLGGAKPYSEAEITALELDRRIAWRAGIPKGAGFFNLAEWEFLLEPRGQDTCLRQRFHYHPQAAAAERMVQAAGSGGIERACAVSLERLKQVAERGAGVLA